MSKSAVNKYLCDCHCVESDLDARHPHGASASAVFEELQFLLRADLSACTNCPAIMHFQASVNGRKKVARLQKLERVARTAYAADPCRRADDLQCIVERAWRVVRASTLATDLAALSTCDSKRIRKARALLQSCGGSPTVRSSWEVRQRWLFLSLRASKPAAH